MTSLMLLAQGSEFDNPVVVLILMACIVYFIYDIFFKSAVKGYFERRRQKKAARAAEEETLDTSRAPREPQMVIPKRPSMTRPDDL